MLIQLPHGIYSFVRHMPKDFLRFENEDTGEVLLLSHHELSQLIRSGEAKAIEAVTDRWHDWGRPEVLFTDRGLGPTD
jgi:hypothetical protein